MNETGLLGVAVVTGGASGIGAACCREWARRGATVAVLDRNSAAAGAIAREGAGRAWTADVTEVSTRPLIAVGSWLRPGTPTEA